MNATVLAAKTGIAPIGAGHARWVGLCMLAGAALLVAGCWAGVADPQARALVLGLLSGGMAMFAAALMLLRRRPVHVMAGVAAPAPASTDRRLLDAPPATPTDAGIAEPASGRAQGAAVEPRPAPVLVGTGPVPAAAIVHPTRPGEGLLDVTALMDAPLADLLLAALCKDPVGARRIFAKALESGAASVAPGAPSTPGVPVPSALPANGEAGTVVVGPPPTTSA